jgi:hypothetical protein
MLDVNAADMKSFKTFLQPGDRLNIQGIYSESVKVTDKDVYGNDVIKDVDVFKTEVVFRDIMLADLINGDGESILDIYASYNDMTVWEQAQLDASASFVARTTPSTMLVALTNEELERYYFYKAKSNIQFKVSLPQRME